MNASSFITFGINMLRQNGTRFYQGLYMMRSAGKGPLWVDVHVFSFLHFSIGICSSN